uniref:Uncharacterized protein n=1 Tax=Globodera rostochiensis TaxID=31243 RepID=A0A914I8W8_GLORO
MFSSVTIRLAALFALCLFAALSSAAPGANPRHHQKESKKDHHLKKSDDDYDYRVDDDYSIGVFIDAVPTIEKSAKKTSSDDGKAYQRTNRYPTRKLRKFFDESKARREWYEALFRPERR